MYSLPITEDVISGVPYWISDVPEAIFDLTTVELVKLDMLNGWQFVKVMVPVSFEYVLITAALLQFCCLFFNTFVFIYYRKIRETTRPYILSLIALDLLLVFVNLTSFVVILAGQYNYVLIPYKVSYMTFIFGFGFYLYPSFFLACDRFLVVLFPLKFKEYSLKVRIAKSIWLSVHFLCLFCLCVFKLVPNGEHVLLKILNLIFVFYVIVLTLATFLLYVILAAHIIRSNLEMSKLRDKSINSK